MSLSLKTAPTGEPITLTQVKQQCRLVDSSDEDGFLSLIVIPAVRDRAELATQRQLLQATYELKFNDWPYQYGYIDIPKPPLIYAIASDLSITYVDTAGTVQTWAATNYIVDAPAGPRCTRGRISLAYGAAWPTVQDRMNAITVTFKAGYGTAGTSVPPLLVSAMLLDAGTLNENRESLLVDRGSVTLVEVPGTSKDIYAKYATHAPQR